MFNCGLKINEEALDEVTTFFKSRGRELTEINKQQAALPTCCEKITNTMGTAPGMWFEKNGKVFVSMPGVPHEMKNMMTNIVVPKLKQTFNTPFIYHKVIRTTGIGESFLADKISEWEKNIPQHIKLAYLPSYDGVKLRLTTIGYDEQKLKADTAVLVKKLEPFAAEYIYGYGDDAMEVVVGNILREKSLTLSAAESCTGGYLSHLITSIPGSSHYFLGSIISYANNIKTDQLGINLKTLQQLGAVSEQTVTEMANQVRLKFKSNIGVATSGIAGPDGGTADKPVGTVWIAYADGNKTITKKLQLAKDRIFNIKMASAATLNLIHENLK